jgi:hypothetical protein
MGVGGDVIGYSMPLRGDIGGERRKREAWKPAKCEGMGEMTGGEGGASSATYSSAEDSFAGGGVFGLTRRSLEPLERARERERRLRAGVDGRSEGPSDGRTSPPLSSVVSVLSSV